MKKYLWLAMVALVGTFAIGCTAEVPECEDTEAAGAEAADDSPCDDEAAPPKQAAALSNEEQEWCGDHFCH